MTIEALSIKICARVIKGRNPRPLKEFRVAGALEDF